MFSSILLLNSHALGNHEMQFSRSFCIRQDKRFEAEELESVYSLIGNETLRFCCHFGAQNYNMYLAAEDESAFALSVG